MIVCKLSLILLAISCYRLPAASAANIIDLIEWSIVGKGPELRAEAENESAPGGQRNCLCDGPSCICCIDFNLTFVDLGGPGCVRMKYLSQDEGFAVNVSYGNNLLHSQVVKGPDPEPTCMNLLTRVAQFCARLTELAPTSDGLRGCLQLEPTLLGEAQIEFPLGCFRSGPNGMAMEPQKTNATAEEETSESPEEPSSINAAQILQVVNESAEQGIAFFTNLLGLSFGNRANGTEADDGEGTTTSSATSKPGSDPQPSPTENKHQRNSKQMHYERGPNDI